MMRPTRYGMLRYGHVDVYDCAIAIFGLLVNGHETIINIALR
jgi:hypothetical protein